MRKILSTLCFTSLIAGGLLFTSCADGLNSNFPSESSNFAYIAGVNYSDDSSVTYKKVSDTIAGDLDTGLQQDYYYFWSSDKKTEYIIKWSNDVDDTTKVAVSVSAYSDFNKCVSDFEDDTNSPHSIEVKKNTKVYIRVRPYNRSFLYTGKYWLTVSGKAAAIDLIKYEQ